MAFATDAQRRWFFAHLATGMRRIAGKMRQHEEAKRVDRMSHEEYHRKIADPARQKWEAEQARIAESEGMLQAGGVVRRVSGGATAALHRLQDTKQESAKKAYRLREPKRPSWYKKKRNPFD